MFGKNATWPGSGCSTEMPSNRYSLVRGRPPLMRGSGEPRRQHGHAGHEAGEGDEAAAVQRQIDDLALVDDVAEPGRVAAEERRVAGDGDRFGDAADVEVKVEAHGLAGGQRHPGRATTGLKPARTTLMR